MKKKFITELLLCLTLTLTACGAGDDRTGQEASAGNNDTSVINNVSESESGADTTTDTTADAPAESSDAAAGDAQENSTGNNPAANETTVVPVIVPTKVSVSYSEYSDEATADDGTVLATRTVRIPSVTIEGNEQAANKINASLQERSDPSVSSEVTEWATEDYEFRKENGDTFNFPYTEDIYIDTTRMDDSVIAFELTASSFTGGAHGNYGSVGLNYSTQTGEQIAFDELADDPAAFRSAALDYLTDLAKTPAYAERLYTDETMRGDLETVLFAEEHWLFSDTGIVFISDPYALGPYAAGTIYFTIPYDDAVGMGLKEQYVSTGNYTQARYYTSSYDPESGELNADGTPDYAFDLNGDGTEDTIAFYGSVYDETAGKSSVTIYINGTELGSAISEQIDLTKGFLDSQYLLYDLDPGDPYTEIGVPFFELSDENNVSYTAYTYFFRYTKGGELIYMGMIDGNAAADASADFGSFR